MSLILLSVSQTKFLQINFFFSSDIPQFIQANVPTNVLFVPSRLEIAKQKYIMNGFTLEKNLTNVPFVVGLLPRKAIVIPMNSHAMAKPYLLKQVLLATYVAKFICQMRA